MFKNLLKLSIFGILLFAPTQFVSAAHDLGHHEIQKIADKKSGHHEGRHGHHGNWNGHRHWDRHNNWHRNWNYYPYYYNNFSYGYYPYYYSYYPYYYTTPYYYDYPGTGVYFYLR
jgi:hypothetical protein